MSTCLGRQGAQILGQTFWVCLWGCSWMTLALELGDWVPLFLWVCLIQLVEWVEQKSWPPTNKGEFLLPDCFSAGTSFFLYSHSDWNIYSSWVSLPLKWNYTAGCSCSQAFCSSWTGATPLALLGLQLDNSPCEFWDLPDSIITGVDSLWLISLHTHSMGSFY